MAACCSSATFRFYGSMRLLLFIEFLHLCTLVSPGGAGVWPCGGFALPKADLESTSYSGCPRPEGTCWDDDGFIYFDPREKGSQNSRSATLNLLGKQPSTVELHFCVHSSADSCEGSSVQTEWPTGCYCLFKANGSSCPNAFKNGSLTWIGGRNRLDGTLPSFSGSKSSIQLDFCCRCDGSLSTPVDLPVEAEFFLMSNSEGDGGCQAVKDAVVVPQFVLWDPPGGASQSGEHPAAPFNLTRPQINITFCYYVPDHLVATDMSSTSPEENSAVDFLKFILAPVLATGVIIVLLIMLLVLVCVVLCVVYRRRTGTFHSKRRTASKFEPLLLSDQQEFHHTTSPPEEDDRARLSLHTTSALYTSVNLNGRSRAYETVSLSPADNSQINTSPYYKNVPVESKSPQVSPDSVEEDSSGEFWMPPLDEQVMLASLERWKYCRIPAGNVKLLDLIGKGNFGSVFRAEYLWNDEEVKVVAAKRLHQGANEQNMRLFLQEAAIMGQFRHQNIVKLFGTVTEHDLCYIILEYMSNGNLRDYLLHFKKIIERIPDAEASTMCVRFAKEIAAGMDFLASKRFVHRDLAARNVLLNDNFTAKIGDFGCARNIANDAYYLGSGGMVPVRWTAPEALGYKKYSTASDVWSYGCVLYEIWSLGEKPLMDVEVMKFFPHLKAGNRQHPPPGCPRMIYQIMIDCWHPETSGRPKFNAILYLLGQPSEIVLAWNDKDALVHEHAQTIGANINVGRVLYPDLQNAYIETE